MKEPNKRRLLPWEFTGAIPEGDNADLTRHLTESTVNTLARSLRDLVTMVEVHEDMAPTTSKLILQLCSDIAGDMLAWIRRWPE
ncbi:hypothetical protein [Nocardia brasiliensis]